MAQCPNKLELEAFLDESLQPARLDEIAIHASHCEACQRQLEELSSYLRCIATIGFFSSGP